MRSERDAAITGERIATTQVAELQQLVDQLRLQISGLAEQRDLELRRADRTEAARQQLDGRLHEALETAKSDREDWAEYARSVENRALSDVDRARQEAKELQTQLNSMAEHHRAIERQLRQDLHAAQAAAATASQSANILRGQPKNLCDEQSCCELVLVGCAGWQARAEPEPQPLPCGAREGVDSGNPSFRIMYIMFKAD